MTHAESATKHAQAAIAAMKEAKQAAKDGDYTAALEARKRCDVAKEACHAEHRAAVKEEGALASLAAGQDRLPEAKSIIAALDANGAQHDAWVAEAHAYHRAKKMGKI